jgi:hypothetical protein
LIAQINLQVYAGESDVLIDHFMAAGREFKLVIPFFVSTGPRRGTLDMDGGKWQTVPFCIRYAAFEDALR